MAATTVVGDRRSINGVLIECAECGCLVDRGVIVTPCADYPSCCCEPLPQAPAAVHD